MPETTSTTTPVPAVVRTATHNAQAAWTTLLHAEMRDLPGPRRVSICREVDTELSRRYPRIEFTFDTADELYAWAEHLNAEVTVTTGYASYSPSKSVRHFTATAEWLDTPIALIATVLR
jgi:antibiotic biosynthesis monooxygenase (ABM) superfamily enzyme